MRIAMVYDMIYPFNVGGGEARNYLLAKELAARGHEVHFFGAKLWKGNKTIEHEGIIMHGVYKSRRLYRKGRRGFLEPMVFALRLFFPLMTKKFDVIDCTAFPFFHSFVCKLYSTIRRTPLVLTWHEVWQDYWKYYIGRKGVIAKFIEKRASKLSKNHVVVSERTKKRLQVINPKANIKVISNAIDSAVIEKAKPKREKFDIIYAGRLLPHKNVDVLLKSLVFVKHDFSNIKCLIIGRGPEKDKLVKLAKKLDVQDNVTFMDFLEKQEDVYSYMKSSKIFVLPSILEGFGIVVIEAMACGLPIVGVSHKWNAAEDIINNNKAGFVVDESPEAISEKIIYLLRKKSSYKKFVGNNYIKSHNYDIHKVAKKLEKTYSSLI